MNGRLVLGVLLALLVSCSGDLDSRKGEEKGQEKSDVEQLKMLLKEKKGQEVIGKVLQMMHGLQESASRSVAGDAQADDARQLFDCLYRAYIDSRLMKEGAVCMDSLARIPFWKQNCQYGLAVARARFYQLTGDNGKAIQWANTYMKLPECPDKGRFIMYAENISGVYAYCSNDIGKSIRILETAVDKYRNGGQYEYMPRVISRLGIYYRLTGQYEKAVAANQEVIQNSDDKSPTQGALMAYGEQANLYADLGMYKQALQQNAKAVCYSLMNDSFALGDLYRYRAEIFGKVQNKDSAFYYLAQGGKVSARLRSLGGIIVNKIEVIRACLNYPDSLDRAVQLGMSICPDTVHMPRWAQYQLELYLGQALQKTGRAAEGIPLIEKAACGFNAIAMPNLEYEANRVLMDHYRMMKMNDAFMRCYARNWVFSDSLQEDEKLRAVAAANIRFDSERKEQENELLSAKVEMQSQQLFYQVCISIILLLLFISSIAYLINKWKTNRLMMERSKREIQKLIARQQELSQHNEQLTKQVEEVTVRETMASIGKLTGHSLLSKEDENAFRQSFAAMYPSYLPKVRESYPQFTRNEELLAMLICMNQSTDEIALIMGINRSSVNVVRSRMRKKMELSKDDSLDERLKRYM